MIAYCDRQRIHSCVFVRLADVAHILHLLLHSCLHMSSSSFFLAPLKVGAHELFGHSFVPGVNMERSGHVRLDNADVEATQPGCKPFHPRRVSRQSPMGDLFRILCVIHAYINLYLLL